MTREDAACDVIEDLILNGDDFADVPREWLQRCIDESDRASGRVRRLVMRMIERKRKEHPSRADVQAALEEALRDQEAGELMPIALVRYVARYYVASASRTTERKTRPRTMWEDIAVVASYFVTLAKLRDSEDTKEVRTTALKMTGEAFGMSAKTVSRIVAEVTESKPPADTCPECERSNGPHYRGPCEH